ncbi:LacI family DNA-binding transcriptional regulator [Streptomyces sp. NPDC002701]|uniref:LacI family DNA-binding transcriptional regulator n=1 Tax=Streptomyces sp. NPDC002701 TaxID=3364661 RepID=UPI0036BE18E1
MSEDEVGSRPPVRMKPFQRKRKAAQPDRRSTIRDVAERAGISVATASRTRAGNYPVSADT